LGQRTTFGLLGLLCCSLWRFHIMRDGLQHRFGFIPQCEFVR
jgi:hypothetical protein